MSSSSSELFEPEHSIEQCSLALSIVSKQGELRPRDSPIVVNQAKEGCTVFVSFVALLEEEFRIFVRNYDTFDASADISVGGESLGKWLIAREPRAWHNIGCDSLFKFQDSYDRQSKTYEPSTIVIRFQHLSKVTKAPEDGGLVPVTVREPSLEDEPNYLPLSEDMIHSKFEPVEDSQFLTFIISFNPPPVTTFLPILSQPAVDLVPGPASLSSSEGGSTTSSDSISQMSDDELQEALTEHKSSRLLLPARLTPGFWGKLPMEDFCRRYQLPEDILSVLKQMKIKDAHSLSRVYLRELQNNRMDLRSISMLRLAVIRFSSESRP